MVSRSEEQMMQLIIDVAVKNPLIRAVTLNGSRANPNVKRDIFQDFDIIYAVTTLSPFISEPGWIDVFGKRMILQTPEDMELYPVEPELEGSFSYLMQFLDGNRVDLALVPLEHLPRFINDSLCKVLLDKDNMPLLSSIPPPTDLDYKTKKPSQRSFNDCCNEFWYTNAGLAKGLWREQLPHVQQLFSGVIRAALMQMIDWHIGCRYGFTVNPGKWGKFYKEYMEPELYDKFLLTYSSSDPNNIWRAVYMSIEIFRKTAFDVSEKLGYSYPIEEDQNVAQYLQHVEHLPKNATGIYVD